MFGYHENSALLTWDALSVLRNCFVMVGCLALHFLFELCSVAGPCWQAYLIIGMVAEERLC